jgi:hypothetical protein
MSHQLCAAVCLTPAARQGEFRASQYPDGSIVFSVMLKDERVQYLLVPPGRIATMDRKFKLGDSVNIIGSERSAVVDDIDTGFGVAVYGVRFDDQLASHQWFAAHELVPRARDKLVSRWMLVIAGIVDYGLVASVIESMVFF